MIPIIYVLQYRGLTEEFGPRDWVEPNIKGSDPDVVMANARKIWAETGIAYEFRVVQRVDTVVQTATTPW